MKNGYDIETFDSAEPYKIQLNQIKQFNLHWHNYIEIFYVKKGRIRLQTGEFSFHLDEGHICFINSNTIHSVNQTDLENEILILQIPTESHRPFYTLRNYKFNSATYLADFSKDTAPLEELQNLLDDIYKESILKAAGYNQIILGYINLLLGLMIRKFYLIPKTEEDYLAEKNLARLSDIIGYLDEHYTEKVSLQTIADSLHMNYYYLSHFFKDTSGISFQDYLNHLRVDKSLPLLAEVDNSITDIALDSGFPNIKAYTKAFKEKFGVLPSVYRKNITSSIEQPLTEDQLLQNYTKQMETSVPSAPLDLYSKLNLTPKENRFFSQDISLSSTLPKTPVEENHQLFFPVSLLHAVRPDQLKSLIHTLDIRELCLYHPESEPQDVCFFRQQAAFLHISDIRFLPESERCLPQPFSESHMSMIDAVTHTLDFLENSMQIPACHLQLYSAVLSAPLFSYSNCYQTSFGSFTPLFYADSFIHKLRGSMLCHGDGWAVFQQNDSYQILCCHKKSLQMYRSLTESASFHRENYMFFVNSFPHMKFSFLFQSVTHQMKQTTYILSEEHGSIFSEWYRLGTPEYLDPDLASYLTDVTKPSVNTFQLPFQEKPLISVDLPPLGIAYVELTPIV